MSRLGLFAILVGIAACAGGTQDNPPSKPTGGGDKIAVPGGDKIAVPGGAESTGTPKAPAIGGDDRAKLHPQEGKLAIETPADAKAGAETTAKIIVTPGSGYHVNTEYPIKLTIAPTDGVSIAKAEFVAGGHDKSKGDADALDEQNLTISVKLTPAKSGSYTLNGNFKFAVCDKDQCLPKREQIAIVVAAK